MPMFGDFHFTIRHDEALLSLLAAQPYLLMQHAGRGALPQAAGHAWLPWLFGLRDARLRADHVTPGVDEEVYRKLPWAPIACRGLAGFARYGMTKEDWRRLQPIEEDARCGKNASRGGRFLPPPP